MNAYYAQWSHAELMSMHGVEKSAYHDDDHDDEEEESEEYCCSGCMSCLGLSW